jgi:hypothetical protein
MTFQTERYENSSQVLIIILFLFLFFVAIFQANKIKNLYGNLNSIAWLKLKNFGPKKEMRGVLPNIYFPMRVTKL